MSRETEFKEIVEKRRAVRLFDEDYDFDHDVVTRSLEKAILAPTSSNLQLWEAYRIRSTELREEMNKFCLDQPGAKTASELVVFVCRRDKWKSRVNFNYDVLKKAADADGGVAPEALNYYSKLMPFVYFGDRFGIIGFFKSILAWAMGVSKPMFREMAETDTRIVVHKSCALVAQTFMLAVTSEGYSTLPMEGIDTKRIKKALKLPGRAEINMVVAVGKEKEGGVFGKRLRLDKSDLILVR